MTLLNKFLPFILFLSFNTVAKTQLILSDNCSGLPSSIMTSYGIDIKLKISDYNPHLAMKLKVEFLPYTNLLEHVNVAPIVYNMNYTGNRNTRGRSRRLQAVLPHKNFMVGILAPKIKKLIKHERKLRSSNIWTIRASWFQPDGKLGTAQKSFIRMKSTETFYEITSAGLCNWESRSAVSSKLYTNNTDSVMSITREYNTLHQSNSSRGLALGPNNTTGNNPLSTQNNTAWFFKDWNKTFEVQAISMIQRRWSLSKDESGVFGDRYSFTRKKAKQWVWEWNSSRTCKYYQPKSEGLLDIGISTEDFYILPEYLYGTNQMNTFMDRYRPRVNTCRHSVYDNSNYVDQTIINKDKSILYYYKKTELQ